MKEQNEPQGGGYPLPDIAATEKTAVEGPLNWVGMAGLDIPLKLSVSGNEIVIPARGSAYVNLEVPEAKGIHMSRLYLAVEKHLGTEVFSPGSLKKLLEEFISSHKGLSSAGAFLARFEVPVRRKALVSDNWGWRQYPVEIRGELAGGQLKLFLQTEVLYSSTCPCSAALAKQLIGQQFEKDFGSQSSVSADVVREWLNSEHGIVATPHSQRSVALIKVRLAPQADSFKILETIDAVEAALKTPVQAAVKREDEQEFARLNGQNLMFCEDAGRRGAQALEELNYVADFYAKCSHLESLHPHDAVSVVTKGVPGGFTASL
jgi:GTP cyclohydrolase I